MKYGRKIIFLHILRGDSGATIILWIVGDADEFRAGHTNLWTREESSLGHTLPSNSCPLIPVLLSGAPLTSALYCPWPLCPQPLHFGRSFSHPLLP